ncbi:ribonuclease P protein component [Nakamurella antarctica]|uniref:Ribonuclease P protein component n=1 Tax=Nakamurella antarctica TaxID=1902245 RepID=A0A3G8ZZ37_9ACTN|nr:ribonuclease P protein component [Nakamurella antarctica]AZI59286.1 ribonuclease P protein component [Nakamurella antarctica]
MLPTESRLHTAAEFSAVMRSGVRVGSRHVAVHLQRSGRDGVPRAGFVVSSKVGNSVVRHGVTRKLRHQIRPLLLDLAPGTDVVVRALPASISATSAELRSDLVSSISRALSKVAGSPRSTHAARARKDKRG